VRPNETGTTDPELLEAVVNALAYHGHDARCAPMILGNIRASGYEIVRSDDEHYALSVSGAAVKKGVHPHTVRAAIRRGELRAEKVGRIYLIPHWALRQWTPRSSGRPLAERGKS